MAGVNNPPNLKPLIDAQSAEQALDFSWLKSIAAGNKLKLEKANTDLAAVHESVNSSSAATQNAVTQSVVDSAAATNAARDLVISELTQQVSTLTTAVNAVPKSPIKSIQRGVTLMQGEHWKEINISTVDLSKSVIISSFESAQYSGAYSVIPMVRFKNASVIRISQNSPANSDLSWEVIEYV
ncbi:hypothetical protein QL989_16135 [Pseudoalteromonas sp. APC 3224]|uniref:hypothetical protein n=1 Tax=Pseudoalteromonas sp. APC 3224 TaxID=3035203 RepID=UPI0025B56C10|nr:hypothetical protein [Pseudoalteromonas sp. APC 3224]MDN3486868.1 hypothetical protein [Pseudoalteromonas sp. APC 3224]